MARQIYANQEGFFDTCQEGKLEKADAEWRKSDRQCDIEPYEHSFLDPTPQNTHQKTQYQ